MKKVIFICLLSLTTCLSRPDGAGAPAVPAPGNPAVPASVPADTHAAKEQAPQNASSVIPPSAAPTNATQTLPPTAPTAAAPTNATTVAPPPTDAKTNDTTNKTTDKGTVPVPPSNKTETTTTAPEKNDAKPADTKPTNATVPEDNKKNETTITSTVHPPKAIEAAGRGFDGPSFLGGMILTLGLLAIGFMGFKYYRNQTERNYHTL